jgi:predicted metal-dependent phosphoesterase TrpH
MIDLHTHSSASDGDLTPPELIEKAAALGVTTLALTDHDTVSGLEAAEKAAKSRGIHFIPGVELEIQTEDPAFPLIRGEFHLLGLGIRSPMAEFHTTLDNLAGARDRRNRKMVEKIQAAGIEADYEAVKAFAGGGLVGRPHFGAFLISKKLVKNQEQAFKRYLGKDRPFYAPKEGLPFEKAARLIHEAGGIAVLAHPMSLYLAWGRLPQFIEKLKDRGLDGIEAWHPTAKLKACKRLDELGRSLGLCVTAGSDFHGSARPDRKLGHTAGGRKIDEDLVQGFCSFARTAGEITPGLVLSARRRTL